MIIGIIALYITYKIPIRLYHKYSVLIYVLSVISILIPYFISNPTSANRWIFIGSIGIQPSEYAKWISIILLARYLSNRKRTVRRFSSFIIPVFIVLIPALIVFGQPDLGTAAIMITPIITILFWANSRKFHIFLIIAPILSIITAFHTISFTIWAIILLLVIILSEKRIWNGVLIYFGNIFLGLLAPILWNVLQPYQQKRILTLFNPELDPLGAAYHIIQSQTAIGSGGLFGKGWMQGTQTHLKYLPVQESDFILSVIGEEFGFITVFLIFILYAIIIYKIFQFAFLTKEKFASIVLIGLGTVFLAQIFVNSAMTVGLIPVKGLPLPFLSAGGSFLVSSFMMIGIMLNFATHWSD
jgi:rod shape determining protein RodA